mmetsp:Transcript_57492/g.136752  ORF Transcript_57492/g.136752 Transcript_57492/m.136752 type:complete len:447 (-) Transcript_57492:40-1380(-)
MSTARGGSSPDITHVGSSNTRFVKGSNTTKPSNTDGKGLLEMLKHPLNIMLLCIPLGFAAEIFRWGDIPKFWFNFFGMIPLAKILGDATEELAAGLKNDMLAGLLNATFGNAVEMVITVQTMRKGYYDLVKATLLGSVLSNMLLVLGMSFFCGGLIADDNKKSPETPGSTDPSGIPRIPPRTEFSTAHFVAEKVQHFHVLGALVNISMLLLSCFSFMIVTIFCSSRDEDGLPLFVEQVLPVSRAGSLIVISAYAAYIIFQLGTHRASLAVDEEDDEDGEGEPALSLCMSTVVLFVTTLFVAASSELLVGAIEGVTAKNHVGAHFIGIILLPIIGNACEHAAAVRFGIKDKLGLSIGIAIGSSTQIALFAVPFAVLAGWAVDRPMDLNFGQLNTSIMTVSVVVVLSMVVDGKSNWLQGYLLMAAYLLVAVCYWYLPGEIAGEGESKL